MSPTENKGKQVELEFQELAFAKLNVPIVKSSDHDDMTKHVDFWIGGQGYDVKARRSIRRHEPAQDEYVYIELSNTRGNAGWLFGEADFIAFEQEYFWIISPRKLLVEVIRKKLHHGSKVAAPAPYKIYTRKNRYDRITLIPTKDIYLSEPTIWSKVLPN